MPTGTGLATWRRTLLFIFPCWVGIGYLTCLPAQADPGREKGWTPGKDLYSHRLNCGQAGRLLFPRTVGDRTPPDLCLSPMPSPSQKQFNELPVELCQAWRQAGEEEGAAPHTCLPALLPPALEEPGVWRLP